MTLAARPRQLTPVALGLLIAAATALLPLKPALAVALGAPLAALALLRPEWLLYGLPLLVPFHYAVPIAIGGFRIGLVDLALAALAAAWLARSVARRRLCLTAGALGPPLLLWLWLAALSLLASRSLSAGLTEAIKWGQVVLVYLLVLALLPRSGQRWLVYGIAAAGAVSALIGLRQFLSGSGPEGFLLFGRFMRAYGTFQQPNPFAGHLGLSLPFALAWGLGARGRPRPERLAMLAAASLMAAGVLVSWSRGSWLALAASVAVVGFLLSPRLALAAATVGLVAALLAGGGLANNPLADRLLGMGDVGTLDVERVIPTDENFAVVERLAHWQAGWRMFDAHPWLGVGIGNYEAAYPEFALPRWPAALGHAHNYYLNLAAETGLLGLLGFAVLGLSVLGWTTVSLLRKPCVATRPLLLGLAGSLVYASVHSLVDNLFVHGMQVLIGLGLGALAWVAAARDGADADTLTGSEEA